MSGTDKDKEAARINVRILDKDYLIACPHDERSALLDSAELLRVARECARMRVALKRGDDAEELAAPEWTIGGTTVRYDVWRGSRGANTGT